MAAPCFGAFGSYKHLRPKPFSPPSSAESNCIWVTRRYRPTDLRSTAPVPAFKLVASRTLPQAPAQWLTVSETDPNTFSRGREESQTYFTTAGTRCEEWSTLRQMLPSRGRALREFPPNWGTNNGNQPNMTGQRQTRFPIIDSPMNRYLNEMQLKDKMFRLY